MHKKKSKLSLKQVIKSVLAAMFGVQSSRAHYQDFTYGKPWHYISVGIILVIFFILILYGVVHFILMNAVH